MVTPSSQVLSEKIKYTPGIGDFRCVSENGCQYGSGGISSNSESVLHVPCSKPKARVPNRSTPHGLMVGNQSEGLTGLKSSTMQVNSGNITQTSFGFLKLITPWKHSSMNLALLIWRMRNLFQSNFITYIDDECNGSLDMRLKQRQKEELQKEKEKF
jgi:hypothetical protein